MSHSLEAVLSAILVLLCLMYALTVVGNESAEGGEKELKLICEDAMSAMEKTGVLKDVVRKLKSGKSEEACVEVRAFLPEDVGFLFEVSGSFAAEAGEKGVRPEPPTVSAHRLVALNETEFYDVALVTWWRR